MREIKFRGMDISGHWFYGLVSMPRYGKYKGDVFISNAGGNPLAYEIRPETLGEYAGQKDKNGVVEVYESDIGKLGEYICYLIWDKLNAQFRWIDTVTEQWIQGRPSDAEVIGNIHEGVNKCKPESYFALLTSRLAKTGIKLWRS